MFSVALMFSNHFFSTPDSHGYPRSLRWLGVEVGLSIAINKRGDGIAGE